MELKYVGPKPIISHTGIDFDNNKEDKFAYLNIAVQLLKALSHDYFENKVYKYDADTSRLRNSELIHELKKYCPDLDELMHIKNHNIEEEIQHNLDRAAESETLRDEDKQALKNNINIMHDYIVQRSINKSVYYCAIDSLAKLLQKDHIDYLIAPMFQKFAHVLHSVQGVLQKDEFEIDTKIEIYQEDGKLLVKLQVINN
ncbi:MAG: hypothetical protein H8E76_07405 [Helicobacteraceae bacterium]|nr:hypothetical protein [Candidatus Sulfurimonas ponti]